MLCHYVIRLFLCLFFAASCAVGQHLSNGADVRDVVHDLIDDSHVVLFTKSYCPHCKASVSLMKRLKEEIDFRLNIVELDNQPDAEDGRKIQKNLLDLTGQRTVPNVFINGAHIGGNSDLQGMHAKGELVNKLMEIGGVTEL